MAELTATDGMLIIGIGFKLLKLKRIAMTDPLSAIVRVCALGHLSL